MTAIVEYPNIASARAHFKDLVDAAVAGVPSHLHRESQGIALVDAERLRHFVGRITTAAEVVAEAGGWSVFIPGVPVAADGASYDEAIAEMVEALREYAEDWVDHLRLAPNHRDHWGLVQLVALSSDEQLAQWLTGARPA
ncbi:MAG: prevent-host-death protein [Jatrophihabitantaceae bacterium]